MAVRALPTLRCPATAGLFEGLKAGLYELASMVVPRSFGRRP